MKSKHIQYHFAAFNGGSHQICFNNLEDSTQTIDFLIEVGVEAKDYSNIVTRGHLKPVELEAKKIEDMVADARKELEHNTFMEYAL